MNVLPIVFSILMLLAIMTYSQLQNFLIRNSIDQEYTCWVENRSRNSINILQEKLYDEHQTTKEREKKVLERADGSSKISLKWFVAEPKGDEWFWRKQQVHREILSRLTYILYGERKFFKEAEEKRPDIVNELWASVIEKLKEYDSQKTWINTVEHLETLELEDPELSEFLSHLLRKVETPQSLKAGSGLKEVKDVQKKVEYYPNLLDFLTKRSATQAYRLWLLEKPLLLALFQDESVVEEIIRERKHLHGILRPYKGDQLGPKKVELSCQFEQMFKIKIPPDIPEDLVNFQVSKS